MDLDLGSFILLLLYLVFGVEKILLTSLTIKVRPKCEQ